MHSLSHLKVIVKSRLVTLMVFTALTNLRYVTLSYCNTFILSVCTLKVL